MSTLPVANTFEGGSNGTTLTTGNSGGTSGNAFDTVSVGSTGTVTYDSAQSMHGTYSAKMVSDANWTGPSAVYWNTTSAAPYFYTRLYVRTLTAPASASHTYLYGSSVAFGSTGKFIITRNNEADIVTGTYTYLANTWYRVEVEYLISATVGQVTAKIYLGDSTTPVDTVQTPATWSVGVPAPGIGFSYIWIPRAATMWFDDVGANNTGWLGPTSTQISDSDTFTFTDAITDRTFSDTETIQFKDTTKKGSFPVWVSKVVSGVNEIVRTVQTYSSTWQVLPSITTVSATSSFTWQTNSRNLLTYNQATIEIDSTGWMSWGAPYGTLSQSTTYAAEGTHSLAVTATGTTQIIAATSTGNPYLVTNGTAVTAGTVYSALASVRASVATLTGYLRIYWFDASGTSLSSVTSSGVSVTTSGFTQMSVLGVTAPATTAWATLAIIATTPAIGDVLYIDKASIARGSSTLWESPLVPVSVTKASTWNDALAISATSASTWGVAGVASSGSTSTWVDKASIATTYASTYNVKTTVLVADLVSWLDKSAATQTSASIWIDSASVAKTSASTWTNKSPVVLASSSTFWIAPKTENFTDTFDGPNLDPRWTVNSGTYSIASGRLQLDGGVAGSGTTVRTKYSYDFSESYLSVKFDVSSASAATSMYMLVYTNSANAAKYVGWQTTSTSTHLSMIVNASTVGVLTYDPAVHVYVRVRHSGTTVYGDTSVDGVTWTPQFNITDTDNVTASRIALNAVNGSGAQYVYFDNLNVGTHPVSVTSSSTWSDVGKVVATSSSTWSDIAHVTVTDSVTWNIHVYMTQASTWTVRTSVSKSVASTWIIRNFMSALSDTFDGPSLAPHWAYSNNASIVAGQLKLHSPVSDFSDLGRVQTNYFYDLDWSSISVQVIPPNPLPEGYRAYMTMNSKAQMDLGVAPFEMGIEGVDSFGNKILRFGSEGGAPVPTSVTYDRVSMAYWRLRESGNVRYWDTSPDGVNWTNQSNTTGTYIPDAYEVELATDGYVGDTYFDNLLGLDTGKVTATSSSTWSNVAHIYQTSASTWADKATVAQTESSTWNVLTTSAATSSSTWTIKQVALQTELNTWATKAVTSSSSASTWTVKATAAQTSASVWLDLSKFSIASDSTWTDRALAANSSTSTWTTKASISSSSSSTWTVKTPAVQTSASAWTVKAVASTSVQSTWVILTPAVSTSASAWTVKAVVANTDSVTWVTKAATSVSSASTWTIKTPASTTFSSTWSDIAHVATSSASTWQAKLAVAASNTTTWTVKAAIAQAQGATWLTLQATSITSEQLFNIRQVAVASSASTWQDLLTTSNTSSSSWNTLVPATQSSVSSWTVRALVASTSASSWNDIQTIVSTISSTWNDAQTGVLAAFTSVSWTVDTVATASYSGSWNSGVVVSMSSASAWTDNLLVALLESLTWTIAKTVVSTETSSWLDAEIVSSSATSSWADLETVAVSSISTWSDQALVAQTSATTWLDLSSVSITTLSTWHVTTIGAVSNEYDVVWVANILTSVSSTVAWLDSSVVSHVVSSTWTDNLTVVSSAASTWNNRQSIASAAASTWLDAVSLSVTKTLAWADNSTILPASISTTWSISSQVSVTIMATWSTRQFVLSTRPVSWTISTIGAVASSFSALWAVASIVASVNVVSWVAQQKVQRANQATWVDRTVTLSTTNATWQQLQRLATSEATSWLINAHVGTSVVESWGIGGTVSIVDPFTWVVYRFQLPSKASPVGVGRMLGPVGTGREVNNG